MVMEQASSKNSFSIKPLSTSARLSASNDENIEIKKVLFSHERPNDISESIRVFGENIEYSTHEDSIVVNSKFVLNNAKFDAGNLSSVVNFQLDNPVQLDGQYGDFIANVKRVIIKNISTNKIKAKDIGTDLDVKVSLFCLLYTSPSPRDQRGSRMPSSA